MIIAVCGQKGGISKTTTSCMLAAEACRRGLKVRILDTDQGQWSATSWTERARNQLGVWPKNQPPIAESLESTSLASLQLYRSSGSDWDFTVVDTPPAVNRSHVAVMLIADLILLPTGPASTELEALSRTLGVLQEAQQARERPAMVRVYLTRLQAGTAACEGAREAVSACGMPLLKTTMSRHIAYEYAMNTGTGLHANPVWRHAYDEILALWREIQTIKEPNHAKSRANGSICSIQSRRPVQRQGRSAHAKAREHAL